MGGKRTCEMDFVGEAMDFDGGANVEEGAPLLTDDTAGLSRGIAQFSVSMSVCCASFEEREDAADSESDLEPEIIDDFVSRKPSFRCVC